jgi:hypothetical protein
VPPHWWIPVKASDPKARKEEVRAIIEDEAGGILEGFWEDEGGNRLYALAMNVDLSPDRQRRLKTDGPVIKLHTKPLKKV